MPCYCSQIPRCREDILTVRQMKFQLEEVNNRNDSVISSRVRNTNDTLGTSAMPDNLGAEQTGIEEENNPFARAINALITECAQKITSLERELSSMISSDRSYHSRRNK